MTQQDIEDNNQEIELNETEQTESSGPSSVSLFVDRIKAWINTQNKTLVYGVSAVVLLLVGVISYQFLYKMPLEKRGLVAIIQTQQDFDNDSFNAVIKKGPALADEFSGTKAGHLAAYMTGASYLYKGDVKKAIEFLEEVSFSDKIMKPQAIGLLGDAHIENKDLDAGLKYYNKAISASENEFSKLWWSKKAARVHEKKNEWSNALDIYTSLKEEFPESEELVEIEKYIARAKAKTDNY
jgi:tetratricopeptide (TPR) repeat protein